MQEILLEGIACAERARGRSFLSWMKNIIKWTKLNFVQFIRGVKDRDYWGGVATDLLISISRRMMMRMVNGRQADFYIAQAWIRF